MVNDDLRLAVARLQETLGALVVAKYTRELPPAHTRTVDFEALGREQLLRLIAEKAAGCSEVWKERYGEIEYLTAELVLLPVLALRDLRDALSQLEEALQRESLKHS